MGIYSNNRFAGVSDIEVGIAEGYDDVTGTQIALIESYQNDLAIFEGTIMNDFKEAGMRFSGVEESEIIAFQEGSVSDLLGKIKAFFVKLWEKIKGIFKSFMAKFDAQFMKSNKEFFNKYKSVVGGKDLAKMKFKGYRKSKTVTFDFPAPSDTASENQMCLSVNALAAKDIDKLREKFDAEEFKCNILNKTISGLNISSSSEYEKEAEDLVYDDPEELDGCTQEVSQASTILLNADTVLKEINKANTSLNKSISKMISEVEKSKSKVAGSFNGGKEHSDISGVKHDFNTEKGATFGNGIKVAEDRRQEIQKCLNYISLQASSIQVCALKFTGMLMKNKKMEVSQARKLFAAAVAYRPKEEGNDILMEAVCELVDFEMEA